MRTDRDLCSHPPASALRGGAAADTPPGRPLPPLFEMLVDYALIALGLILFPILILLAGGEDD